MTLTSSATSQPASTQWQETGKLKSRWIKNNQSPAFVVANVAGMAFEWLRLCDDQEGMQVARFSAHTKNLSTVCIGKKKKKKKEA